MSAALNLHPIANEKGFSLLEVLIALTIMMGSVVVVGMAWRGSQVRIKKMKINHQMAFLLDYKVSDIDRKYKNEITLLPEEDDGNFEELGKEYAGYTWTLKSKKFELPDLTPLMAANKDQIDPMVTMMMDQLGEFFNQAAKEVTISVTFAQKKNKIVYAASRFLIDFNQQLPIPNMGGGAGGMGGGATNGGAAGGGNAGGTEE